MKMLFISLLFLLGVQTGNRDLYTPNGYSDNFPGLGLSGNWTCYFAATWGQPSVGSNSVYNLQGSPTNLTSLCGYTGGSFGANQTSQATVGANGGTSYESQGVCIHVNPASGNGYCWNGATTDVVRIAAGVPTNIGAYCGATYTAGDVIKISNTGSSISVFKNGLQQCSSVTDSTYTTGYPGFTFGYGDRFRILESFGNWLGK
jgi:hypothetical protein